MAISIVMPALEMAQETGKLLVWRKAEGDTIARGDLIADIETDKVVFELEAAESGVLAGIRYGEGSEVKVGETIAWILAPGEAVPTDSVNIQSGRAASTPARSKAEAPAGEDSGDRVINVSPKARRVAQELGVDLATVTGTGPKGAITSEDIQAAAKAAAKPAPVPDVPVPPSGVPPLSNVARLMAERTTQAWTSIPHFFLTCDVDMTEMVALRAKLKPPAGTAKLTITDLLIAVTGRVLKKHEKMNSSWTGTGIRANPSVNISLAIAVKDGVVGTVFGNADSADPASVASRRQDFVERARASQLRAADVEGGTFTISNLGTYGVDAFQAIIVPPQAGILAVGRIADRAVVRDGGVSVRPMMTLTLSSDHRVVDGAQAALFLKDLTDAMHQPEAWLGQP